jgi:hypothetical protein
METIKFHFDLAKKAYDQGQNPLEEIFETAEAAIRKLGTSAVTQYLDTLGSKKYEVFSADGNLSRPYLPAVFLSDPQVFNSTWKLTTAGIDPQCMTINQSATDIDQTLYTAMTAFCCCYDLWNPGARKTPGTFFEILLGSLYGKILPTVKRSKSVPIPNQPEKVATDIVFTDDQKTRSLVIPAKITTRERIVQPFAQQRILDEVFGKKAYDSVLMCVSEMQRAGVNKANEICVPGSINLYQSHLAHLEGIYYLDPPTRYLQPDVTDVISIGTIGSFIKTELPNFF